MANIKISKKPKTSKAWRYSYSIPIHDNHILILAILNYLLKFTFGTSISSIFMHPLKIFALTLCLCLSISNVAFGQKDFREKYDRFRFELYDQLEHHQPFKISNSMAKSMKSFLQEHAKEILTFRKAQLKQYERESTEELSAYTPLNDADLKVIKDQLVFLDAENIISQINESNHSGDYENIRIMLELLSVDPVFIVSTVSAQAMSQVFMNYLDIAVEELTTIYGKMAIGGTYLSTKELDKTHWTMTLNNYYIIYQFSVDINSGEIELLTIKTRN